MIREGEKSEGSVPHLHHAVGVTEEVERDAVGRDLPPLLLLNVQREGAQDHRHLLHHTEGEDHAVRTRNENALLLLPVLSEEDDQVARHLELGVKLRDLRLQPQRNRLGHLQPGIRPIRGEGQDQGVQRGKGQSQGVQQDKGQSQGVQ